MGMVTEMRLRGGEEGGERFNYRGLHRYLITMSPAKPGTSLAQKEIVLKTLAACREACAVHHFELYAYCFLPEKLVMVVRGKSEDADMKKFIADCRLASGNALGPVFGTPFWARTYQERVLRKTEVTRAVAEGVFMLPVTAGRASRPASYEFQGSFVLPAVERVPRPAFSSPKKHPGHRGRGKGPPPGRRTSR